MMESPKLIIFVFGAICTLLVAAIPHLIWLISWCIALLTRHHLRYAPFGWTALGLAAGVILLLSYGFFIGRWQLKVKTLTYCNKEIPATFNDFKIVHISDLHLNTFNDHPEKLEKIVAKINEQSADLICFTGDLVTLGREEAAPYTEILKKLSAKYGVVSVLGNHDFLIYDNRFKNSRERMAAVNELADYESNMLHWSLLRNASKKITLPDGSYITLVGVDNKNTTKQGFKTINCGNLRVALAGTDGFRILLSHDPSHWDAEVVPDTDIPLTLSGHTHAAQISFLGWTPASLLFARAYGRFDEDGQSLYVNPGLGCTAPFRIGARPEITVITLKNAPYDEQQ